MYSLGNINVNPSNICQDMSVCTKVGLTILEPSLEPHQASMNKNCFLVMTLMYLYLRTIHFCTSCFVTVDLINESFLLDLTYKSGFHPNVAQNLTAVPESWQKKKLIIYIHCCHQFGTDLVLVLIFSYLMC